MKITAENYEQWALDYLEGTLPATTREAFDRFLASHPQFKEQICSLQEYMPIAQADTIVFPQPAQLMYRRTVSPFRRIASMVSGAAAAVLVAGAFMFLGRSNPPTTAHNYHRPQTENSNAPQQNLFAQAIPESQQANTATSAQADRDALPQNSLQAGLMAAKSSAKRSSRVREWSRKSTAILERMEARQAQIAQQREVADNKRREQTTLTAQATASSALSATGQSSQKSPANTPQSQTQGATMASINDFTDPSTNSQGLLASNAGTEQPGAFMAESIGEKGQGSPIQLPGILSQLPPDATSPILGASGPYINEELIQEQAYELAQAPQRREGGLLRTLLKPFERISPIKYYENEEGRGVEIASIIRIGSRNN